MKYPIIDKSIYCMLTQLFINNFIMLFGKLRPHLSQKCTFKIIDSK